MMDSKKDLMRSERRDLLKEEDEWKQRMKSLGYYDENVEKDRHMFMSDDGMYVYYLAVIDYLQDFNLSK